MAPGLRPHKSRGLGLRAKLTGLQGSRTPILLLLLLLTDCVKVLNLLTDK